MPEESPGLHARPSANGRSKTPPGRNAIATQSMIFHKRGIAPGITSRNQAMRRRVPLIALLGHHRSPSLVNLAAARLDA
jgi:hypothetical protein